MVYTNVHTHHAHSIEGLYPSIDVVQDINSVGIHPWALKDMSDDDIDEVIHNIVHKLEHNDNKEIMAIGECGIDKLCTSALNLQIEVFERHIQLSEQYRLPIIIHCVKAMDELLSIKKKLSPTLPWIWHGFRGKPQQLQQLLNAGFYISFGAKYNKASLLACPLNRMFLETDDADVSIQSVYEQVCKDLCIDVCQLHNNSDLFCNIEK